MNQSSRMTEKQRDAGAPEAAALPRSPTEKPPFTFADIRNAVPPHCFRRSLLRSSAYLLRDLAISGFFLWFALAVIPALPLRLHLAAWPLYWAAQGSVLFGVWVIAHECGHGAFSDYPLLNDAVGLLLHSALLAPNFSWKYSHLRHHAHTCSLDRDEVYVPCRRRDLPWYSERLYGGEEDRPAARLALLAVQLTVGWPMYLVFNTWGRAYPRWASHLDPSSPIYSGGRERAHVAVSDAGLVAAAVALARLAAARGFWWVARVYGAPLLVVNAWLVLVTYLHHTHAALPRYAAGAGAGAGWDWLRGALATVDRDYGAVGRAFIHNIADTHVAHHLFPTIPHYHAVEATKAIRPVLGEYYRFDPTPIAMALWREVKERIYVEPDEDGVFWFSNKF